MSEMFWVIKAARTDKVRVGQVYTTAQLLAMGVRWTDRYNLYLHDWDGLDAWAVPVGEV